MIALSRGEREPYTPAPEWGAVRRVPVEREAEEAAGSFGDASIDRARAVLGYAPRYSALDALREALRWLAANGRADVGGAAFQ